MHRNPSCVGCLNYRQQVVPEYRSCKQQRLCDLIDPGLLSFAYVESLEAYEKVHDELLRGVRELEMRQREPMPSSEAEFVRAVLDAHRILFGYALPHTAGRFRGDTEEVTFGGEGGNKREGALSEDIERGVENSFKLATSHKPDWNTERRAAAFMVTFFGFIHSWMVMGELHDFSFRKFAERITNTFQSGTPSVNPAVSTSQPSNMRIVTMSIVGSVHSYILKNGL